MQSTRKNRWWTPVSETQRKPSFRTLGRVRRGRLPKPLMPYIDPRSWGHVAEWLRNGLQNRVHQFNSGRGLQSFQILRPRQKTRCHRIATAEGSRLFLFRAANLGERHLHDVRGARVGIGKQVAIDIERDCGRGVPDSPADGQDVEPGRYQLRNVGVA